MAAASAKTLVSLDVASNAVSTASHIMLIKICRKDKLIGSFVW